VNPTQVRSNQAQAIMFLKNLVMAGGYVLLASVGAGQLSLDARRRKASRGKAMTPVGDGLQPYPAHVLGPSAAFGKRSFDDEAPSC